MKSVVILSALLCAAAAKDEYDVPIPDHVKGKIFPKSFQFGVSTSSYQVEGGWLEGAKGFSTWDAFSHIPGRIANGDTGDIANDMYHKYPEDAALMKKYGIKNYRFSIAWNRIMPTGVAPVNQEAIDYYNDLINTLLANGVEPHVTMYHSETPLALTLYPNNPMPFLDVERFPGWFTDYAKVLFDNFGDRVKNWFTFNEPWCSAVLGIDGDSDPYTIAHSAILAHGSVYRLYQESYKTAQSGQVGIVLNTAHFFPADPTNPDDVLAAQTQYDFSYGWFIDPLTKGAYPQSMVDKVGSRLPSFTAAQKLMIAGSLDFVALNYYFPYIVAPGTFTDADAGSWYKDQNTTAYFDPSWPLNEMGWGIYAPGLRELLLYTHVNYGLPIYVTENGLAWREDNATVAIKDVERQQFLHDHIQAVGDALIGGADVRGYFVWSFQDNFEWGSGYQMHFGLIYIERPSLVRVVKNSLRWYSALLSLFGKLNA